MRVLITVHYFPPHLGGIEIVAQNQAKYLVKQGHEVDVLTSAINFKKGQHLHEDNYNVHRVPAWNFFESKYKIPFPIFYPQLFFRTYKLVKRSDVVHIHDVFYMSSMVTAFTAFFLHKPVVLTQHVHVSPYPQRVVRFIQSFIYKTAGKIIFKNCKKIIIFNSKVKKFIISFGIEAQKITLLPNGIDTLTFCPTKEGEREAIRKKYKIPSSKTAIVYVGRFIRLKGFYKLLKSGGDDYVIVFVGDKAPKHDGKNLIFIDKVDHEELSRIYRACDIFILPSDGEGFPISMQEAMATGLPVITNFDDGYDVYNFNSNLLKFIKPTPSNIKKAINELVGNNELLHKMAEYSHNFAIQNFDIKKNTKELSKLYKGVAS